MLFGVLEQDLNYVFPPLLRCYYRYSVEVLPIYVITAAAIGGASWYITRLARGPDVVWDHKVSCYKREG